MAILPVSSTSHLDTYQIDGGATIRDKTQGVAKAVFSANYAAEHQAPAYLIYVNEKKIIWPQAPNVKKQSDLVLLNSVTITFNKIDNNVFKISELDETDKHVIYVDTSRCIDNEAYCFYEFIPKQLTLEESSLKVAEFFGSVEFHPYAIAFNQFGVVALGMENEQLTLYWAKPQEEQLKKIQCIDSVRLKYPGKIIMRADEGDIDFRYESGKGYFLNGAQVTLIPAADFGVSQGDITQFLIESNNLQ